MANFGEVRHHQNVYRRAADAKRHHVSLQTIKKARLRTASPSKFESELMSFAISLSDANAARSHRPSRQATKRAGSGIRHRCWRGTSCRGGWHRRRRSNRLPYRVSMYRHCAPIALPVRLPVGARLGLKAKLLSPACRVDTVSVSIDEYGLIVSVAHVEDTAIGIPSGIDRHIWHVASVADVS